MILSEGDIQYAIYCYRRSIQPFPNLLTNIYFWHWESDALYITDDGYLHEFEIKLTHSDFLADAKKRTKHSRLENGGGPATFHYVCHPDVIKVDEVPDYAGLVYVIERKGYYDKTATLTLHIVKKAPRRKSEPLNQKRCWELMSKGITRYWHLFEHHWDKRRNGG